MARVARPVVPAAPPRPLPESQADSAATDVSRLHLLRRSESPSTPGGFSHRDTPSLLKHFFERPGPADAENPVASCNLHVLVDEAAEPISS